ncbi:hypothetical protein [Legionella bononiensis]|uniref:Transmembrane protein n=1 Tax=Legionella bononiensis TaxID=2793102 RepID=A0ABS1WCA9_9GAMM|nr:hypothetical protein [Legionella bononiensis]MBL7478861.1 hypothetical protein [Legionella bononiensis]MBL7526991.1 hypothetical protein [Legionella bononiensis]MBL7562415.1 hypothetical protein [Legionella bononiensis]
MPTAHYRSVVNESLESINSLPLCEAKYYLWLTVKTLQNEETELNYLLLKELVRFSTSLSNLIQNMNDPEHIEQLISNTMHTYNQMVSLSQTRTLNIQLAYYIINIGSTFLAILTGIIGGLIGGVAGLARGVWNLGNPLSYFLLGILTGFLIGAAIGFRLPKKILMDDLTRKLKFCMDGIGECLQSIDRQMIKPTAEYEHKVKTMLLEQYFDGNEELYQLFISQNTIKYTITTFSALFVGTTLKGYLGNHACIIIKIDEDKKPILIEFTNGPSDLSQVPTQVEHRTVSGSQIFDMLVLHEQLQETNACDLTFTFTKAKPGDNDCFTYINKLLKGTNQAVTELKRFTEQETWVGKNIVGYSIQNLSLFSHKELTTQNMDAGKHHSLNYC